MLGFTVLIKVVKYASLTWCLRKEKKKKEKEIRMSPKGIGQPGGVEVVD